jgi:hypothetical protein
MGTDIWIVLVSRAMSRGCTTEEVGAGEKKKIAKGFPCYTKSLIITLQIAIPSTCVILLGVMEPISAAIDL